MIFRSTFTLATVALLAGCGLSDAPAQTKFYTDCADHSEIAKGVDWSNAETIAISFEDRMFSEGLIELTSGQPYILQINNNENFPHWFRAVDFFRDSYISKVTYNGQEQPGKCLEALQMSASSSSEVHLIPAAVNDYEYQDSPFIVIGMGEVLWNSDTGFIFVR